MLFLIASDPPRHNFHLLLAAPASMGFQWERFEAWRKHPMLNNNLRLRTSLPGLGIATVAFAGFVAYDKLVVGDSHGHH